MKVKYTKASFVIRMIISALILCIGVLGFVFEKEINNLIQGEAVKAVNNSTFQMYVVDVGQGDSIFIKLPDNKNMLIDCGKKNEYDKLERFLNEKKVTKINYFIYTHSDEDHVGGGQGVFKNYDVEVLYRPKVLSKTENERFGNPNDFEVRDTITYDDSIMIAYEETGCEIRYSFKGEEIIGMDYSVKFLSPNKDTYSSFNSYSAVIMLEIYGKKILLTGDAEEDIEKELIEQYGDYLDSDILKVAHHGSNTASSSDFLNIVTPTYALISVGENQWGMPHKEVLDRLNYANVNNIYDTKSSETIAMGISQSEIINLYLYCGVYSFDRALFICVLSVLLLLVWGIRKIKIKPKK